jgi:alpha-amylase
MKSDFEAVSWSRNTVVYEVNLRQYTAQGTLEAFRPHMKRLADMGVGVLWFMPITPISVLNRKGSLGSYYACSSYVQISPEFGTIEEWKELVKQAHGLGLKVIMDWVANHTGWDHEWTQTNPEFYKKNQDGLFYDAHGWDDVIDLDYSNTEMRLTMIDAMKYWVNETEIDGFRCDMAMLTPVDFWAQARKSLEQLKPLFWLAELDPLDNPEYSRVFDAAYTWRWMNATQDFYQNGSHNIHHLRHVIELYGNTLPSSFAPAWFTSNHDENSWNGTEMEKYGDMAKPLAVFSATWKGLPLLYSGQEIPNPKRLKFFEKDPIEWERGSGLHEFYKKLFDLRGLNNGLQNTEDFQQCIQIWNSVDHHVFSFRRKGDGEILLVLINFSGWDLPEVNFSSVDAQGTYVDLFSNESISLEQESHTISIPAWGYRILVKNKADQF